MGFCLVGFFPQRCRNFCCSKGPTRMCQGMSEQVKDLSWGDEEIREKLLSTERKIDGERRERKGHILGK